jgi:formylglycine-generating enzyme required for sulfatase activity/class 3 adenylate cyclase
LREVAPDDIATLFIATLFGRIWEDIIVSDRSSHLSRRSAAVLYAQIIDYSRLVETGDHGTYTRVKRHLREVVEPIIAERHGHVAKITGDSLYAVFDSALEAVVCAVVIQQAMEQRNAALATHQWMQYRIGINHGDVIVEPDDVFGQGVNIAARLQSIAEPGALYISGSVYDQIKELLGCVYHALGDERLKDVAEPVRVYQVQHNATATAPAEEVRQLNWRAVALAASFAALLVGGGWLAWQGFEPTRAMVAIFAQGASPATPELPSFEDQNPLPAAPAPAPAAPEQRATPRPTAVGQANPAQPIPGVRAAILPPTPQTGSVPDQRLATAALVPPGPEQRLAARQSIGIGAAESRALESSLPAPPGLPPAAPASAAPAPKLQQQALLGQPLRAVAHRPAVAREIIRDCEHCPELIEIPGGTFTMGSTDDPSEKPPHRVTVAGFALGRFSVTNGEWRQCVAAQACGYQPGGHDDSPVHNVSWADAQQYLAWLSQLTGRKYRLPTEAEWEYAARASTSTKYWWGNQVILGMANCKGCGEPYQPNEPVRVGTYEPNPYGLYDMAGGVAQWTADCWHKDYQGAPKDSSAWDLANCRERVLRGGSWRNDTDYLRASSRAYYDASVRYPGHGFRVVRSP